MRWPANTLSQLKVYIVVRLTSSSVGFLRQLMDLPKVPGIISDPDDINVKLLRLRVDSEGEQWLVPLVTVICLLTDL